LVACRPFLSKDDLQELEPLISMGWKANCRDHSRIINAAEDPDIAAALDDWVMVKHGIVADKKFCCPKHFFLHGFLSYLIFAWPLASLMPYRPEQRTGGWPVAWE
jgi:hypothetical protein